MKRSRLFIILGVTLLTVGVLLVCGGYYLKKKANDFFYPTAPTMPAVVTASMPEVLERLDKTLAEKAPHVLKALQPGLSREAIDQLESKYHVTLSEELKLLYQWHDGTPWPTNAPITEFIPGHHFLSLEDTLKETSENLESLKKASVIQRGVASFLTAHRDSWICLFDDNAGDGFFFDPQRQTNQGAIFSCFTETSSYTFFPSLKNLLSAITEFYEQGGFYVKQGSNPPEIEENAEFSAKIWPKYGSDNPQSEHIN